MKRLGLTGWIVIGTVAGMLVGHFVGPNIAGIKFIGDIFLRLIQMSVVLLVMGAVIEAVGALDPKELGRLGVKTIVLFMLTTALAATTGLILADIFRPGAGLTSPVAELAGTYKSPDTTWTEIVTNFFPRNVIESMARGEMIQVIVFAVLFGVALSLLAKSDSGSNIIRIVKQFNVIILQVVKIVMKAAPVGIFALLAWVTGYIGLAVVRSLAVFLLCMLVSAIITFVIVLLVTSAYARLNPIKLALKMNRMAVIAITTTSSAITLPTKMSDSETRIGISPRVSRLVNPLGMALNSDGLALYLAIACMTVAQFFNVEMSVGTQIQVVVVSVLATLGTVVVPGGGLVALAIVFPTLGLPLEGIALLAGVDWFSGMIRTAMNVVDDVMVAVIVAASENELDRNIFDNELPDAA